MKLGIPENGANVKSKEERRRIKKSKVSSTEGKGNEGLCCSALENIE